MKISVEKQPLLKSLFAGFLLFNVAGPGFYWGLIQSRFNAHPAPPGLLHKAPARVLAASKPAPVVVPLQK